MGLVDKAFLAAGMSDDRLELRAAQKLNTVDGNKIPELLLLGVASVVEGEVGLAKEELHQVRCSHPTDQPAY